MPLRWCALRQTRGGQIMTGIEAYHDPHPHRTGQTGETAPPQRNRPTHRHPGRECSVMALLCLALYTLLVSHVYLLHAPWMGVSQPQSVLSWSLAGALLLLAAGTPTLRAALRPTRFMGLCLAGAVVLSIPLLYAPYTWRYLSDLRVAGVWGGLLLMVAVRALFSTCLLRRAALNLVLAGVTLEALTGIAQLLWPHLLLAGMAAPPHGRATGVFGQANVLASLVGTGIMLSGHLLTTQTSALQRHPRTMPRCNLTQGALLLCTAVLAVCLPLTQSTMVWVFALLAAVQALATPHVSPRQRILRRVWLAVVVIGLLLGLELWQGLRGDMLSHAAGRLGRLQLWQTSLWMIAQHPWLGWGYGHFEMAYVQAWQTTGNVPVVDHSVIGHPHNELLYWLVEGGAVAGIGLLLLLAAGLQLAVRSGRALRTRLQTRIIVQHNPAGTARAATATSGNAEAFGLVCCTLPILIHTQLEWPWYLSAWHYLVVLMLLSFADAALNACTAHGATITAGTLGPIPQNLTEKLHVVDAPPSANARRPHPRTHACRFAVLPARLVLLLAGAGTLWGMLTALPLGMQLSLAETQGVTPARLQVIEVAHQRNPWALNERVWRVETVVLANAAYQSNDPQRLLPVIAWEEQYLLRHPDPEATVLLLKHLRFAGRTDKLQAATARARAMFPWDERFSETHPAGTTNTTNSDNTQRRTETNPAPAPRTERSAQ